MYCTVLTPLHAHTRTTALTHEHIDWKCIDIRVERDALNAPYQCAGMCACVYRTLIYFASSIHRYVVQSSNGFAGLFISSPSSLPTYRFFSLFLMDSMLPLLLLRLLLLLLPLLWPARTGIVFVIYNIYIYIVVVVSACTANTHSMPCGYQSFHHPCSYTLDPSHTRSPIPNSFLYT